MQSISDQSQDPQGVELHRIVQRYGAPEYVKSAAWDSLTDPRLPGHLYADPRGRRFPCHNKAAVWVSAAHFLEQQSQLQGRERVKIAEALEQRATLWGILPDLVALRSRRRELEKEAAQPLPDSMFAFLRTNHKTGQVERRLKIATTQEVQQAATWLLRYRDEIPYADRQQIADRVLNKSASFGHVLADEPQVELEKIAGRGVCRPSDVVEALHQRAYCARGETRDQLRKLATLIQARPGVALKRAKLQKFAAILDEIDRGLRLHYGPDLPRPEDVLFAARFKQARAELDQQVRLLTGSVYEREQFQKLALADLENALGSDFAREVRTGLGEVDAEKLAEHAAILPLPDQEILEQVFSRSGLKPVLKQASAAVEWQRYLPAA